MSAVKWRSLAVTSAVTVTAAGMLAVLAAPASAAAALKAAAYQVTDLGGGTAMYEGFARRVAATP
jgi:hypothetical protein